MINYLKQYRFYITLFIFLLIPLISLDTSMRSARDYRFYDRVVVGLTAPLQSIISGTLEYFLSSLENYVFLWHTHRDNLILIEENRKLLNALADLREINQENIRLKRLLDFRENISFKTVVARIIAKDISQEFRSLRINRGESSGIKPHMAVLAGEGVVGRVLRTTSQSADVVTILDPLSAVDAVVERSRARGIVEGYTDETCQLRYALRTDDIQPGDLLLTSGLGGVFPKGLAVGVVALVNRQLYGITQEVEVKPTVDFGKLEEILVVLNDDFE